jgi:rare lipoprotein A
MCSPINMTAKSHSKTIAATLVAAVLYFIAFGSDCSADTPETNASAPNGAPQASKPHQDRSGEERVGKASFYAKRFSGKKMADGRLMNPLENNAASRTLPLGTIARVTNLETGKSAVITIQDRGPYAHGRIVDLSPTTAQYIGISREQGVARVAVAPITVPLPDGGVKLGSAATADDVRIASSGKKDHRLDYSRR